MKLGLGNFFGIQYKQLPERVLNKKSVLTGIFHKQCSKSVPSINKRHTALP